MTQDEAFKILKGEKNIFLTGGPGSGKSYLTRKYINWCVDNGFTPAVTASTGIASLQINGQTLHSFIGVRNDDELSQDDFLQIVNNFFVQKRIQITDVLIIDEISMVSPKLLNTANAIISKIKGNTEPFGGIKVVLVGDFFQLPPVSKSQNPPYAFESESWEALDLEVCYLTEQHRTNDEVFTEILRGIRTNTLTEEQKNIIRSRVIEDASEIDAIRLDTHNEKVDKINDTKLFHHEGIPQTYKMVTSGNEKLIAQLVKNCQSPESLTLKIGVHVMFTQNDKDKRWVNGTRGEVVELRDSEVIVKTGRGGTHAVEMTDWKFTEGYGKNEKTKARISQIPLRLAYAITIHKSQGMTLDSAIIDATRAFACGHGYVAVSRVRSLDGLYFQGKLTKRLFATDDRVKEFDKSLPR